jgi:hypothetical protein
LLGFFPSLGWMLPSPMKNQVCSFFFFPHTLTCACARTHTHLTFFKMPSISLNSFFLCAHTLAHIYLLNFFKNSFYFPNPDACLYQILPELFWFSLSYTLVFSIPCNSLLLKFYSHFVLLLFFYFYSNPHPKHFISDSRILSSFL